MRKKKRIFLMGVFALIGLIGCSPADVMASETSQAPVIMCSIRITEGGTILDGVLYDNGTARGFAEMLPLTVELWHPAPNFARAFDLPKEITAHEIPGYEYELGSLAYWDAGPSIALIYEASRKETIVPVVPIGRITSDVAVFDEYGGVITVELGETMQLTPERRSIGKKL